MSLCPNYLDQFIYVETYKYSKREKLKKKKKMVCTKKSKNIRAYTRGRQVKKLLLRKVKVRKKEYNISKYYMVSLKTTYL